MRLLLCLLLSLSPAFAINAVRMNEIDLMVRGRGSGFLLPELVVFDLDMCLWSPEMFELDAVPSEQDRVLGPLADSVGAVAVNSGGHTISLFPDALLILQYYQANHKDLPFRIAAASSADTPLAVKIGAAAMGILEIAPGVAMRQVFGLGWPDGFRGNMQIGRTSPLTADKSATHFPILKRETGIDYNKMVFFDDCGWTDHCKAVGEAHGVVCVKTPNMKGLRLGHFGEALERYNARGKR